MIFTGADRDLAETLFAQINRETRVPGEGVCRPSYGRGETIAWQILAEAAIDLGLHARSDAAGNLVITASDGPIPTRSTWVGSHLDSVPRGGNYDGLAGVVAALLLVAKTREKKCTLPIVGLGLRGEESAWFGVPYLGSKAILGKLQTCDLDRRRRVDPTEAPTVEFDGPPVRSTPTLRSCMEQIGVSGDAIVGKVPLTVDQVAEFWELHIEQGPLLAARGKPVGVVTGIRGNVRARDARIVGQSGHSGTTPHDLRDDAVVRFVEVMTLLEARRKILCLRGHDLVFTCGIVGTDPKKHSITTIADEICLALDVRSLSDHRARKFLAFAEAMGVELGEVVETPAAEIAETTWGRAARACADLGVEHEVMPSGACHDAAIFQQAGVPSGMVFIRNANGSHNPAEAMDLDDFMIGCEVLWRTIAEGART